MFNQTSIVVILVGVLLRERTRCVILVVISGPKSCD